MSKLYGTIDGAARTRATRRGHSTLVTHAACWQGAIRTELVCRDDGVTVYEVSMIPWQGSGGERRLLSTGTLDARTAADESDCALLRRQAG